MQALKGLCSPALDKPKTDVRIFRVRVSSIISLREQSSAQRICAAFIGPLQHSITPAAVRLSAENLGQSVTMLITHSHRQNSAMKWKSFLYICGTRREMF